MRVHSPTSVGATRRPMSALTSVDLPDLSRPAIATRSGSPSRRRTSVTWAWVAPPRRLPTSAHRSATRELNGPGATASAPVLRHGQTDRRLREAGGFSHNADVPSGVQGVDLAHYSLLGAISTVMSRTYGTHIT